MNTTIEYIPLNLGLIRPDANLNTRFGGIPGTTDSSRDVLELSSSRGSFDRRRRFLHPGGTVGTGPTVHGRSRITGATSRLRELGGVWQVVGTSLTIGIRGIQAQPR